MKISCVEHIDGFFDNHKIFWLVVQDVPVEFVEKAKAIDGDSYMEDCFGICVIQDEDEWFICQDEINCELFYIDENGDKNWFEFLLGDFEKEVIEYCKKTIV